MDPIEQIKLLQLNLEVKFPGDLRVKTTTISFADQFCGCVSPLPRDREVPFMPRAREQAHEMIRERRRLAEALSKILAEQFIRMLEERDPQHGYSPEEWSQINKPVSRS